MSINPLKEFFRRRKAEAKFSRAGPGKTLSNEAGTSSDSAATARQAAADAAMKRFNKDNSKPAQRPRMTQTTTATDTTTSQLGFRKPEDVGLSEGSSSVHKDLLVIDGMPQRDIQVYSTEELAQKIKHPDVDDDFFRLTVDDVKLIQQRFNEERARNEILKTREMRRREAEAEKPTTNVARLRFKLPNNFVLEASFSGSETLDSIRNWLAVTCQDKIELDMQNFDILMGLKPFKGPDFDKTVKQLGLIPATTLTVVLKSV